MALYKRGDRVRHTTLGEVKVTGIGQRVSLVGQIETAYRVVRIERDHAGVLCMAEHECSEHDLSPVKPPIGVLPAFLWREQRVEDLYAAVERYVRAGLLQSHHKTIARWLAEADELLIPALRDRKVDYGA